MPVPIMAVERRCPARRAGIMAGETLYRINGHEITDVLDYRFYMLEERLTLEVGTTADRRQVTVTKGEYEDLGLEFATYLMDKQRTCKNKCIFCFVDQMPPGFRDSLYFKDDDARLSFLFGNYITLTNLTDREVERILQMHISPINISVHTTNPTLRTAMMKNPAAADSLRYLTRLAEHSIKINTQLVLCPGLNDGAELARSLRELAALSPAVESIACVPVGVTKFREHLTPLRAYTGEEAAQVLDLIAQAGDEFVQQYGRRIAYAADEFYLLAGRELPAAEHYGGFDQLENGVGLLALLRQEFREALEDTAAELAQARQVTIATGTAAAPLLGELAALAMRRFPQLDCRVLAIRNEFFGESITVAGLITGQDLTTQLTGRPLGEQLLISSSMLRHEQDRFLDDLTPQEVAAALGVPLGVVDNDGTALLRHLLGIAC